jgi:POT family proton-dependent oligopeptide transporter
MGKEKHPAGLYVLFFTEMWERFGFYSMLAMFTLYLQDDRGLGWTLKQATRLYSYYLASVYFTPLIGGFIADKKLGYRNSVLIGGLIFMVGYFLMAIRSEIIVYVSLACLVIGNGFFKPNVSAMVGHLYPEGSTLKDRAYNIFYMGINIGALLAPINAELLVNGFNFNLSFLGISKPLVFEGVGYNPAFAIAGFGMIFSVAILWSFKHYVDRGPQQTEAGEQTAVRRSNPIEAVPDARRITALLVIFLIVIVFWMVFHQNGSTLTYWGNDNTDWDVSGIISNAINPFWVVALSFPVVWMWHLLSQFGLEPSIPFKMTIGMFLTAGSFGILYSAAKTGEGTSYNPEMHASADFRITERAIRNLEAEGVPAEVIEKLRSEDEHQNKVIQGKKFATNKNHPDKPSGAQQLTDALQKLIGNEQTARYGPAILKEAYLFKVSPFWLLLSYAVVTLGELMLSPMGLSLVSKVAPVRLRGMMMGGWFVATSIGNALTMIGIYWDEWLHSTFFAVLGIMALIMGFVLLMLLKPLQKAMPGV